MKVYISGPITNNEGYMKKFQAAERELKKRGFETVNPATVLDPLPNTTTHAEYMHVSYALMDLCQGIFLLEGWKNSKGATLEYKYATASRMAIFFEGGK